MKPNTNTGILIHITPHHLALSPALSQFVYDKVARLPRFASDALAADVVLRRHHGTAEGKRFSASARLALPGRDLHATATHADLYSAVTALTKKLARQSRKRETRRVSAPRRRRSPRNHRLAMLRNSLARWTEAPQSPDVEDAFIPSAEADSCSRGPNLRYTAQMANGLVECSSSSNPAHGISFHYLECLAGYSRARAGASDTFLRATPTRHMEDTA